MTLGELAAAAGLDWAGSSRAGEVAGAVATDLLSAVLAEGEPGDVWLTIQTHQNVAAVAATLELAAVVLTGGRVPSPELLALADESGVAVLRSGESTYVVGGRLWELGVR